MSNDEADKNNIFQHHNEAIGRLRRLQQNSRANIPALMTQRVTTSFTLHEEPAPQNRDIFVVVYPQDPFVGEPEVRRMHAVDVHDGLVNSRIRVESTFLPPAKPDEEGNFLYWPGTPEFGQVNAFYYTNFTLRMYERYAHRQIPWSFPSPRITVDPQVGSEANAFYSEQDRLLGFHTFRVNGEEVNTSYSADIVSHEAAHAILDGLRDFYNESFGLATSAFHESFGDISAVLVALHDDSLVQRLLNWTKGDLRLDNFIAAVGEQMTTQLMQAEMRHMHGHTIYLRNALNKLVFKPFDALPYALENPELELGREPHNYSRLFTGAVYDIMVGIYEQLSASMPPHIAVIKSRDILGSILVCAVELGPVGEFDFADMACAFITAEHILYEDKYGAVLRDVFCEKRQILSTTQAQARLDYIKNLPDLRLPNTLNSALASALFLEEQVIPALNLPKDIELIPLTTYRNASGHAYLTYFTMQQFLLEGEAFGQYNGASTDVFGGLTLMFDSDNYLRSAFYRPVTDEDLRQIQVMILDLINSGLVAHSLNLLQTLRDLPFHAQPHTPHGLWITQADLHPAAQSRLVKFPVIFDRLNQKRLPLLDYLRAWSRRG